MNMKTVITYILAGVAATSALLASGVKQVANWWEIARPFFIIFYVCVALGILINNWNYVRRVTYPVLVCFSAWAYKHRICMTAFTRNTYRVYKSQNKSYKQLFGYTQDLFDLYLEGLSNDAA